MAYKMCILSAGAASNHLREPRKPKLHRSRTVSISVPIMAILGLASSLQTLMYEEITGGDLLGLSSDDWILTQVTRSYSHNMICNNCKPIRGAQKIAFVTCSDKSGPIQLTGLSRMHCYSKSCALFELGLSQEAPETKLKYLYGPWFINDFVNLKGWVYAIDTKGNLYVLDHKESQLLMVTSKEIPGEFSSVFGMWLVVSDGDLYLVLAPECYYKFSIFRLIVIQDDYNGMIERAEWKKVRDLGERVFFLTKNGSYSVPAQDLPHPWKGNCIVYVHDHGFCSDDPKGKEIEVFFVEARRPRPRSMESLQGYSDLFDFP